MRYRRGFAFAMPGLGKTQQNDMYLALASPLAYTGVQIRGRFGGVEGTEAKKRVRFELDLPPETISLGEQGNALKLDLVAVARGTDGKQAANLSQHIERKLQPAQADIIRSEGIHYTNRLEVPPGNYGVWFVVRDTNSGRIGTVRNKLERDACMIRRGGSVS